jgi:hypothetical protein
VLENEITYISAGVEPWNFRHSAEDEGNLPDR